MTYYIYVYFLLFAIMRARHTQNVSRRCPEKKCGGITNFYMYDWELSGHTLRNILAIYIPLSLISKTLPRVTLLLTSSIWSCRSRRRVNLALPLFNKRYDFYFCIITFLSLNSNVLSSMYNVHLWWICQIRHLLDSQLLPSMSLINLEKELICFMR